MLVEQDSHLALEHLLLLTKLIQISVLPHGCQQWPRKNTTEGINAIWA